MSFQMGTLPTVTFPGGGATGTATGNLSATLNAGVAFNGTIITPVTDPAAVPISAVHVKLTSNGAASFLGATPGNVGGVGLFKGVASLKWGGGLTLLDVPLQIGDNATTTASSYGINVTAISGDWTVGATTVVTPMGATAMATGTNSLTAGGGGQITLVNPVLILSNLSGGDFLFAAFGTLTLTYVPEPGTVLLLGLGVLGLALRGRRIR